MHRYLAVLSLLFFPLSALAQASSIAEPGPVELLPLLLQAVTGRQYVLLGALALLVVVYVVRKVGAQVLPWLGTPRGGALLSVVGGTLTVLVGALAAGQPLSLGLVLSAVSAALTAAGLWSTGKNLAKPQAVEPVCTPADRARGLC